MTGGVEQNRSVEGGSGKSVHRPIGQQAWVETESAPIIGSGGTVFGAERPVRRVSVLRPQREAGGDGASRLRRTVEMSTGGERVEHTLKPGVAVDLTRQTEQQQGQVDTDPTEPSEGQKKTPFTPRQLEVLQMRAEGLSLGQIATRLGEPEKTISNHLTAATGRIPAHSPFETVITAVARGYVTPHEDPDIREKMDTLTQRQQEVAKKLTAKNGRVNEAQDLADAFGISKNTIDEHVGEIIRKLGVHSKLEAAAVMRASERQLTNRERDIFVLRAKGLTNKETGTEMSHAEVTVEQHITEAFDRMGIVKRRGSMVAAVMRAIDLGEIGLDEVASGRDVSKLANLKPKELEVVAALTDHSEGGMSQAQIAAKTGLAVRSVNAYITRALRKTDSPNAVALAVLYKASQSEQ